MRQEALRDDIFDNTVAPIPSEPLPENHGHYREMPELGLATVAHGRLSSSDRPVEPRAPIDRGPMRPSPVFVAGSLWALAIVLTSPGPAAAQTSMRVSPAAGSAEGSPAAGSAAIAACRATTAIAAATDTPTEFRCDWRAAITGAPGAALTGRFTAQIRGQDGAMTIVEDGGGPTLVAFAATVRSSQRQCTAAVTASRTPDDALVATPADAPGCEIRIVSSGRNLVRVVATACEAYCGMGATFEGTYRLRAK